MTKNHSRAKLATLIIILFFGGMEISSSADMASYQNERITVKNVKRMKDSSVQIVCRTIVESMWYCLGARIKKIAEGLELTFVSVGYKRGQKVEHPRKTCRDGTKVWNVVTIPSNGEASSIRTEKNLVKILRERGEVTFCVSVAFEFSCKFLSIHFVRDGRSFACGPR